MSDRELRAIADRIQATTARGETPAPGDRSRLVTLFLAQAFGAPTGVCVVAPYRGGYAGRLHPTHRRWEVPGGKAEPGEHPRFAAFREFVEETGLVPIGLREVYQGFQVGPEGLYLARVFVASIEGQHGAGTTEDGEDVVGVPWDDLTGPEGLYAATLRAAFPDGPPQR